MLPLGCSWCYQSDQHQSFLKARNDPQIILKITSNEKYRHNHLLADQRQQLMILVEDRSEISERPDLSGRCIVFFGTIRFHRPAPHLVIT